MRRHHSHGFIEIAKMRVGIVAVITRNDQFTCLIGTDRQRNTEVSQQLGKTVGVNAGEFFQRLPNSGIISHDEGWSETLVIRSDAAVFI